MADSNPERILALAGLFQAAGLVQEVACKSTADQSAFNTSIHSIFKINADSVEEIYGGISGLKYGLEIIVKLFDKNNKKKGRQPWTAISDQRQHCHDAAT